MGGGGYRGSLSRGWLAWLGSGFGFTLGQFHPNLTAHLLGKVASVMLHSFMRCELAPAELALPVWGVLAHLGSPLTLLP
jgi:hypothetical protein